MEITTRKINNLSGVKIEAREGGEVLGSAYLYIMHNDLHKEPFGFMENVFVEEKHRGKGIGRKLVESLIEEARHNNCYKIICTSRYDNDKAHILYKNVGFKDHGKEFRIDL